MFRDVMSGAGFGLEFAGKFDSRDRNTEMTRFIIDSVKSA
jgi:hypothetical protein